MILGWDDVSEMARGDGGRKTLWRVQPRTAGGRKPCLATVRGALGGFFKPEKILKARWTDQTVAKTTTEDDAEMMMAGRAMKEGKKDVVARGKVTRVANGSA